MKTVREAFEVEWEWQRGSLMLKDENEGKEWKKTVGEFFFQQGYALGTKELKQTNELLKREIEILRLYGNKDCTAQADNVLDEEIKK